MMDMATFGWALGAFTLVSGGAVVIAALGGTGDGTRVKAQDIRRPPRREQGTHRGDGPSDRAASS